MQKKLTAQQLKALKGKAHHLAPGMIIGANGLTKNLTSQIDQHIKKRELVKIKLPDIEREERKAMAHELAEDLGAAIVQIIGRTVTLYRESDEPKVARAKA